MHLVATVLNNGLDEMHLDESWRDDIHYYEKNHYQNVTILEQND